MGNAHLRLLLVDNYDSFTYNLYQYLAEITGHAPVVVTHDVAWASLDFSVFDAIVISPGPGRPDRPTDFGICRRIIETCPLPILGICLGHQGIGLAHGSVLSPAPHPMHGRSSLIEHDGDSLFDHIPQRFQAVRYHSLLLSQLGTQLRPIAWADGQIMAIRHAHKPLWGLQFHPESIGTEYGKQLLLNFVRQASILTPTDSVWTHLVHVSPVAPSKPSAYTLLHQAVECAAAPSAIFQKRYGDAENVFWLDSTRTDHGTARFSYMGDCSGPDSSRLSYRVSTCTMTVQTQTQRIQSPGPCLDFLEDFMSKNLVSCTETPFEFKGGLVGYLGYELKSETSGKAAHSSSDPDAQFIFATRFLVFDHWESRWFVCALARETNEASQREWIGKTCLELNSQTQCPHPQKRRLDGFKVRHSADEYSVKISTALDLIKQGESYEICLTTQCDGEPVEDSLGVYLTLRSGHDVPFGGYLRFDHLKIASVSPERFLKVSVSGAIEAKPIKGTAARHDDRDEDRRSAQALADSEKDRSENLMIVDLLRNDLGRVSQIGSVKVPKLMDIESYAVHQMVSTVTGQLSAGMSAVDVLKSAFPGGSMTGAPKVRTMEIIDALEGCPRGVYSGSMGYLSLDGAADFNIIIRTILMTPEKTRIGVGGAIVALSDPQAEWNEVLLKAESVLNPLKGYLQT